MAIHVAIPIAAGVAAVGAIGLRLRALAKKKAASGTTASVAAVPPPAPILKPPPPPVQIAPQQTVLEVATKLGLPPSPHPQPPGTRTGTMAELIESLGDPIGFQKRHPDISWDAVTEDMLNAAHDAFKAQQAAKSTVSIPSGAVTGRQAIVTTNDPAPAGDLIIRVQPDPAAAAIPGGGADKGGTVTIVRDVDGTWAEVIWPGGRRPAGRGFARKAFLKLI